MDNEVTTIKNGELVVRTTSLSGTRLPEKVADKLKYVTTYVKAADGTTDLAIKTCDVGGGGGAVWGSITGTLSNQTDLQDALNSKIGIVEGELKVSDGDNIVVEVEDDSKTEIFSDSMSITADGQDSNEATISLNGVNGSILNLTDGSNTIDLKTNSTDGATITKTENNNTEKVVWNKATGTDALTILGNKATQMYAVNIGVGSSSSGLNGSIAIGRSATASGERSIAIGSGSAYTNSSYAQGYSSIAIGYHAKAQAQDSIQLGYGTNSTAKTLQVYDYQLLDGNTGKIPTDRMTKVIELTTTSIELASDNIYNGGELASVSFTLPATVPVNFCAQLNFTSGTTATVLTAPNTITFVGDDCSNGVFTPVASKRYQVLIDSDGVNVNGYVIGR